MNDGSATTLAFELLEAATPDRPGGITIGFGRVISPGTPSTRFREGESILAPVKLTGGGRYDAPVGNCIAVPPEWPAAKALSVAPIAHALWIWDAAELEPGEIAAYTSGSAHDHLLGVVAQWRSARDVIRLDLAADGRTMRRGIVNLPLGDSEAAASALSGAMRAAPGAVAAILTPGASTLDLILEAMPMWGRIVLATLASDPATIDFYNNVHRKGCRLIGVPGSATELLETFWRSAAAVYLGQAMRIVQNDRLVAACAL